MRKTGLTLAQLKKAMNVNKITFTQESESVNEETGETTTWLSHFDIDKRIRYVMPKEHLDPKAKFTLITDEKEANGGKYTNHMILGQAPVIASL